MCGDDGMMLTAGGGLCREGQGEEPRVAGRCYRAVVLRTPTTTARHADHYRCAVGAVVVGAWSTIAPEAK